MPWKEVNVVDQRLEFVLKSFKKNKNFTELCKEYGVSTRIGYKWKTRFLEEGIEGLKDKNKQPHNNPHKTSEEIICEIIRIKNTKLKWGPRKIRRVYANNHPNEKIPCLSTFQRILKKSGFVAQKKKRKQYKSERIQNRVKPERPNDLWTVDFKGWWYTPEKEKCEPLTVRDEYSKYVLAIKILKKADIWSVRAEFEGIFKEYGLPKMIRSDNGPPFASHMAILGLTRLAVWWMSLGIKLDRIDPGSPQQNGGHERMHLDMKNELEGKIDGSLKMHQSVFDVWREEFNNERPHESLDMKTPSMVYEKSDRKYHGTVDYIEYPGGFISRQINHRGYLQYKGHRIFISHVFSGYNMGLKANGKESIQVWFDNNHIGEFDLQTYVFKSILET